MGILPGGDCGTLGTIVGTLTSLPDDALHLIPGVPKHLFDIIWVCAWSMGILMATWTTKGVPYFRVLAPLVILYVYLIIANGFDPLIGLEDVKMNWFDCEGNFKMLRLIPICTAVVAIGATEAYQWYNRRKEEKKICAQVHEQSEMMKKGLRSVANNLVSQTTGTGLLSRAKSFLATRKQQPNAPLGGAGVSEENKPAPGYLGRARDTMRGWWGRMLRKAGGGAPAADAVAAEGAAAGEVAEGLEAMVV